MLKESDNGFDIADKDLEIRGAGELCGLRQHGRLDTDRIMIEDNYEIYSLTHDIAAGWKYDKGIDGDRQVFLKCFAQRSGKYDVSIN